MKQMMGLLPISILSAYFFFISYTDYKFRKIPDKANIALLAARFAIIPLGYPISFDAVFGAVAMFLVFFLVAYKFNAPIGGDIKAVTVTALYFGVGIAILINVVAITVSILWYFIKKDDIRLKKQHIPYGAMMMVSYVVILLGLAIYLRNPIAL